MRVMSNAARSIHLGTARSTVLVRDKKGKPIDSFLSTRGLDLAPEEYEEFKRSNGAYFANDEHVTKGPFANNFGSSAKPVYQSHIESAIYSIQKSITHKQRAER